MKVASRAAVALRHGHVSIDSVARRIVVDDGAGALARVRIAFSGLVRLIVNVSFDSRTVSPMTLTVTVLLVSPGAKTRAAGGG